MLWVIILLEDPLLLHHLQLFKVFHHTIIQDVTVLLCIHSPLNLYKPPNPILTHTPPNHISSSMLDSGSGSAV